MRTKLPLLMALSVLFFTNSAMGMETSQDQKNETGVVIKAELHGNHTVGDAAFYPEGGLISKDTFELMSQKEIERAYKLYAQEKGLSEAELVELATVLPALEQVAKRECETNGKLSHSTIAALLRHEPKLGYGNKEAAQITKDLIKQATSCSQNDILMHKNNIEEIKQFRDYVYEKHNIKQ